METIQATAYEDQLSNNTINLLRMFLDNNIYLSEADSRDLADALFRQICDEADPHVGRIFSELVLQPRLRMYIEH